MSLNLTTIRPHADVSVGAAWGVAPLWQAINNSSNASWIQTLTFPDECEVALQNFAFPVVAGHTARIVRVRIRAVIGDKSDGAVVRVVPYQLVDGYQPHLGIYTGDTPVQAAILDGAYTARTYYGPWTSFDKNGDFWTESYISDMNLRIWTDGDTKVYDVYCDVEFFWEPEMTLTAPLYEDEVLSIFPTFTWTFGNGGLYAFGWLQPVSFADLGTQTKYQIKVYDDDTWNELGFDHTVSSWPTVADTGIVTSSRGRHSFTTIGDDGQPSTPFEHGETYHVVGRVAKSYNGVDWWSDWEIEQFVGSNEGTVTITPYPFATTSSSRIAAAWTIGGGVSQRAYEARIYGQPNPAFPIDFDPNTTDLVPLWSELMTSEDPEFMSDVDAPPGLYRVCVRIQERLFGEWTEWDYEDVFVEYAPGAAPEDPAVTVATDLVNAAIDVSILWAIGAGIAIDTLHVERSYDDVNFTEFYNGPFIVNVKDYGAAFNVPIKYRARVSGLYGSEHRHYSDYGWAPDFITLPIQQVWLKAQSDPSLNARFPVSESWLETEITKRRTPSHPLGSRLPVMSRGTGAGEAGEMTFTVQDDQIPALLALLEHEGKLILQMPKRQLFVEVSDAYTMRDHLFDLRAGETDLRQVTMPFLEVGE